MAKNYLSVYRDRLKDKQLIDTHIKRHCDIYLPFFKDFIFWFRENHLL
ncbi:hypothetical protein PT285_00865 [Lactobacillus sp. ESL0791]|nr:hypothetical protein [Lactobacillus sp. ESL0791]MDF7637989.1 hypothetical protein [Lactobacillus sp. ESL0791]